MSSNSKYSSIPMTDPEGSIKKSRPNNRKKLYILVGTAVIGVALILTSTVFLKTKHKQVPKRSVIMMISDGFGPASETFARQYYTWLDQKDYKTLLPLDEIHIGHSRTQSSSSLVTDSAAGATAFSCAQKSYNGAVGVDPEEYPCGTVLESAKLQHDMLTALVVTSRVTHATPAAFSAHVGDRDWENIIAEQQIGYNPLGRTVDLMFGGGACEFTRNSSSESCRFDDRDLLKEAKENFGWEVLRSKKEYDAIHPHKVKFPLMALLAPGHMSFEMDRNPEEQPALHEMVEKALDILKFKSRKENKGFFMMIEGSRIDMAAHNNDPAAHVHDIFEYQRTIALVKKFVEENPETVLISTSDHETGGFTAGRQVGEEYPDYIWYPEVVSRSKNSTEVLALAWSAALQAGAQNTQDYYLRNVLVKDGLGIDDASEEEIGKLHAWQYTNKTVEELSWIFSDMISRRALIGWSTHGHTAVDVNLYAHGKGTEVLQGSHENTDIGDFIIDYLDLNLKKITNKLVAATNGTRSDSFRASSLADKKRNFYHG